MSANLKHKIFSGILWQGLERVGSQGISFLISIILARLLRPEDFGVIAIMLVFISLCGVFVDSGFSSALIQKKEVTEDDCCSVFFLNIVLAILLYAVLFAAAPLIANFYENSEIIFNLRILSLVLIIRSFSLVQNALLIKRMLFWLNFRISWSGLLLSGTLGCTMAYAGCGIWALIAQQLSNAAVVAIMQWRLVQWRPRLHFEWSRIRSLFQFGWKLLASGFLDTLYNDVYSIIIGKLFSLTTLSYYNRGRSIPQMGMGVVNSTIGTVLYPAFSKIQDDRAQMQRVARNALKNIMFPVVLILTGFFIFAEPLVVLLLTEKWLPCVIFLRLSCLIFLFWPLHTLNLQILTACGRSDIMLYLEIIKKIQLAVIILFTYRYGVVVMVWGLVCSSPLSFIENAWCNRDLIGYSPWAQAVDIAPFFIIATLAGTITLILVQFIQLKLFQIIIGGIFLAIFYIALAILTGNFPKDILFLFKIEKVYE